MAKNLNIVLFVVCVVAFLFITISTGGSAWLKNENSTKGLWKSCPYSSCASYNKVKIWHKACQALAVLACLLSLVGALLSLIELIMDRMFLYFIATSILLAALCILSCLSIYTHYTRNSTMNFGWSYILGWFGCLISIGASILGSILERLLSDKPNDIAFGWKAVSTQQDSYVIGLKV